MINITALNKTAAVLDINDMIGMGGFYAADMRKALDAKAKGVKDLTVRVCSDGGSITEGLGIFTMLAAHKAKVRVEIFGVAASMGSVIAMAGNTIAMAEDSWMMIHNPSGGVEGESDDLRKRADLLDGMRDQIANIYAKRTGMALARIKKMMADETWLTAKQALKLGFCDEVLPAQKMTASLRIRKFKNKPRALQRATNKEDSMNPELLAKLGLEEDATDEDISAAIDALQKAAVENADDEGVDDDDGEGGDDDDDPENADEDDDDQPSNRRRGKTPKNAALALTAALAENRKAARKGKSGKGEQGTLIALFTELRNDIRSVARRVDGGERQRIMAENAAKFTPKLEKVAKNWSLAQLREYVANADDIEPLSEPDDEPTNTRRDRVTSRGGSGAKFTALTKEEKHMASLMGHTEADVLAFKNNNHKLPPKKGA